MADGSGMSFSDGFGAYLSMDPTSEAVRAFESSANEVLGYAQTNAPWLDRTGQARSGLGVEVVEVPGEIRLELFHTVPYGQWLETIQSGEFAIIMPTLELFAQEVFEAAGGRFTGVIGGDL